MGNGGSVCNNIGLKRQLTVLVVGLDNSGKTCTSRALVGETFTDTVPTIGFSKFVTKHKGMSINIFDLGGSARIREIWQNYFAEAHGVVYVVDASDPTRIQEAHQNLSSLMKHPILRGKPLLLLANKQDHFDALDEVDVADKLQLEILANECQTPTRIEICCATQGTGKNIDPIIRIGFHWLVESILRNYDKIQARITDDVATQKLKEEKEKESRKERIQKLKALQNGVEQSVTQVCIEPLNGISQFPPLQDPSNCKNQFPPIQEIKEEWNLPGSVLEVESLSLESPKKTALTLIQNQIEEFKSVNVNPIVAPLLTEVRGTISAPSQLPMDRTVNGKPTTALRNDKVNSASPVASKLNQRNNGKLPPLKKGAHFQKS